MIYLLYKVLFYVTDKEKYSEKVKKNNTERP